MTARYVRSGAAGAANGTSWADAYATLTAAFAGSSAGDVLYVSEDHVETTAAAVTLTSPGTAASPCQIICVDHAGTVPPVSADLRTTATVSTTGASTIAFAGFAYSEGVTYSSGDSSNAASISFNSTSAWCWEIRNCGLKLNNTSSSSRINIGTSAQVIEKLILRNVVLTFGATGQGIQMSHVMFEWLNATSALGGTIPTTLFNTATRLADVKITGVDLSAAGSGKNLINVAGTGAFFRLLDCKLGSSVAITTGTHPGPGGTEVTLVNCDSADTNYRYHKQDYRGTITNETTIVRTGGASDGTTPVSRKMVSTANTKFYSPLESDWIRLWNESTSSITLTIPVITDNVTLKDNDAWIEVEYLGTASFPLGNYASDAPADVLNAGTNQATDAASTWTTTGLTTPVKQSLSVTFTPAHKGVIRARVMLAKASATMYFDPLVQVS